MSRKQAHTKPSTKTIRQVPAKTSKSKKSTLMVNIRPDRRDYKSIVTFIKREFKNVQTSTMPQDVQPMLATITKRPFNDQDWLFEIKWDGYRSLAYMQDNKVQLRSRNNLSFDQYPTIVDALRNWNINAVIDGEITVLNEDGHADFEALQNWKRHGEGYLVYYVFDILWLEGINLMSTPLAKRKEILRKLIPDNGVIRYSDSIEEYGKELFQAAIANELEGIVGKRKDSLYLPGRRSNDWLKMPTETRQEFVIGGWTESENGRPFKSLLFGNYNAKQEFIYVGHSGGGYKDSEMPRILNRLKEIEIGTKPFSNAVKTDSRVHWVKPELVAEIKYASLTSSGSIRKPAIFLGFREDKQPAEVLAQVGVASEPTRKKRELTKPDKKTKADPSEESNWTVLEKEKITTRSNYQFNDGKEIVLTNIEKSLWGAFTKAHLLMYYHSVYSFMLPHLKDRPLSLHIKHNGINAPGLYIKDMEGREPRWAQLFSIERKHKKAGKRDVIDYLVCNDEASLQYIINLGSIDVNPWTSRTDNPHTPDYVIIDLDPSDSDFTKVIEAAQAAKALLDKYKIVAFPKTSGKTGIHIYLPCEGFSFTQARTIAENICTAIHGLVPAKTTTEVSIQKRGNLLYLDPNQNDFTDTVAAPYSVRPFRQPIVSTPLEWKEVNDSLNPLNFDVRTILKRLKQKGDLFAGVILHSNRQKNTGRLKGFL